MEKNTQNSKNAQNTVVVDLNALRTPSKAKSKEPNPNAVPKNDSAYSLLKQKAVSVAEAFGLVKLSRKYDKDAKCFFLSNDNNVANIDEKNMSALHQIVAGEASLGDDKFVIKFTESPSGDTAEDVYNAFYNSETAPRTKSHAHGFYSQNGKPVFFCLQGSSVKMIELTK